MTDLDRARLEAIADALEYQGTVQDAALVRRLARVSEKRQTAGWKLVPKVATEDMLIALGEAVMRRRTGRMDLQELAEGWTAALSSAGRLNLDYGRLGLLGRAGIRSAIPQQVEESWRE